jgi:hypothetical protein
LPIPIVVSFGVFYRKAYNDNSIFINKGEVGCEILEKKEALSIL